MNKATFKQLFKLIFKKFKIKRYLLFKPSDNYKIIFEEI